ncbi:MAG: apolipoprotein N-acyltransferase, partial [Elusimicrobiota bacterium]|nr:apolipoprotein N-acyltransferase [Elusimicrobiota bacterium]
GYTKKEASAKKESFTVAIMQPNTHKLLLEGAPAAIARSITKQIKGLEGKGAKFIIWPESSLYGTFQTGDFFDFMQASSVALNAYQLVGSAYEDAKGDYVSAGLFGQEGILDVYHKNKLVPFGEFLPLNNIFGGVYKDLAVTSFTGDFLEGKTAAKVFELDINNGAKTNKYKFGASICFESLFPNIWRKQAQNGAQFFVNISNDGWFGDTAAPYQHLRINVLRAVENGRAILRSANTGVSAWIDERGKVRFQTALNTQATAVFSFNFQTDAKKTFYTLYGDIFAIICLVISLSALIYTIVFLNTGTYD